jgi:hypothetical protein
MYNSRRYFLECLIGTLTTACFGQGIVQRRVTTQPRGRPSEVPFTCRFVDVGTQSGLSRETVYGGIERKDYIVETIGCGCAFFDYDNDGWLDIFLLSGTRLTNVPPGTSNRLFRNNRDGTFTDVTEKAGLLKTGWACGVCVGDYNNDGFDDLFVTYCGNNVLYRNNGDGSFTDVTQAAGLAQSANRWGTGCTFIDYNRDGNLDLFVANYLGFDIDRAPKPGQKATCIFSGIPVNCGPRGFAEGKHSLYRNNGNGTFTDVSSASGIGTSGRGYALTAVAADFDDDGWPDIYVACDSSPSLLFLNNRDGTFREDAAIRGVAYSDDGQEEAGMGVAVGDYDLDGRLDILKTNFADDTLNLYHNIGNGHFEDANREAGLAVENRFVTWGTGIADFDNDGLPDFFVVAGHVYPEIERRFPSYPFKNPRLIFRSLGNGKFEELIGQDGEGISELHASRGCAFGDFDNDGDVDILIINLNEPPSLLRNDVSRSNSWLKVKLIGTASNRSAIGSRILVKAGTLTQTQEVLSQSSFLSCNDSRLHFGLGKARVAQIRVRWPSGKWQDLSEVSVNQLVTVKEGVGVVPNMGGVLELSRG